MQCVNEAQVAFGQRLRLDLNGKSVGEALAMIHDAIQLDFFADPELGSPTIKQIKLAAKLQRDISGVSRRVADAIIADLMSDLNHEAIKREGLAPDVTVINKHDSLRRKLVISSITDEGTVYFRGGNGAKARSLVRTES
jgi:hypothetical protein